MAYFTIMAELRGCYSDNDSASTSRYQTRRELKDALEWEARIEVAYRLQDVGLLARLHRQHNAIIGQMVAWVDGRRS